MKTVYAVRRKHPVRTAFIILGGIIVVAVCVFLIAQPIMHFFEQNKFSVLDQQSRDLYGRLKAVAPSTDQFNYYSACADIESGDFATGQYDCQITIIMRKQITSVDELVAVQNLYFPIVDKDVSLEGMTPLDPEPGNITKSFIVGSIEKHYTSRSTEVECNYLLQLNQLETMGSDSLQINSYGTPIENGTARLELTFTCEDLSSHAWYHKVNDTSDFFPQS